MSGDKLTKEWVLKNGEKLKIIYSYAVVHKYDTRSEEDVLKILKAIDPENATPEQAATYCKMLQLFRKVFRDKVEENLKEK